MLKLGVAKIDITPDFPVSLAGFKERKGHHIGVGDRLHARIFCFEAADACGVRRRLLLASADLIWWGPDRVPLLQNRIRRLRGCEDAAVLLHATHNHSGPQTTEAFSIDLGTLSNQYLESLEHALLDGILAAADNLEPVFVEHGAGRCEIGINRRRVEGNAVRMAPNPAGPNDTTCTVFRFRGVHGSVKGLLVHFACHPTTTAANRISPDFPGIAMSTLESSLGQGSVAGYLQGCCGDIRPALICDGEFFRGETADVHQLASVLSNSVLNTLSGPMELCQTVPFRLERLVVPLHTDTPEHSSRHIVALEMTYAALASNLVLLTFNAEMVARYGLFVKSEFGAKVLPVAYTNGMIGYVVTEQQLIEGGYEAIDACSYFGLPGPFERSSERCILDAIVSMAKPQ